MILEENDKKPKNDDKKIQKRYTTIKFGLGHSDALEMAKLTQGYAFAFQVLGYLTWKNGGDYKSALGNYKLYLDEFVYDKMWSELSRKDKLVLFGMAKAGTGKVSDVKSLLNMESNEFSPYRIRLIRKGLISGSERGYVAFTLPLFDRYVLENYVD